MRRASKAVATCLVVVGCGSALGADIKGNAFFGWQATGQTFEMATNDFYFAGSFSGALHFDTEDSPLQNSALQCPGYDHVGVSGGGFCINTDADGDKLFLSWDCPNPVAPPKGTIDACTGEIAVTGGTGKFVNAKGGAHMLGVTIASYPDGTSTGYSELTGYAITY